MAMKYELTSDLMTGNSLIDAEHKQLFDAINDLMDACAPVSYTHLRAHET